MAAFRELKFRTKGGFGTTHFKYSVVGPLKRCVKVIKNRIIGDLIILLAVQ